MNDDETFGVINSLPLAAGDLYAALKDVLRYCVSRKITSRVAQALNGMISRGEIKLPEEKE